MCVEINHRSLLQELLVFGVGTMLVQSQSRVI